MKRYLLQTLLLFTFWPIKAQSFRHYSLDNGLPSKRVYKIIQDHTGFMWICTDKGLAKFDGESFKIFTVKDGLPSNDIWDLQPTSDGKIWFFTKAKKLGYIENDRVYSYEIPSQTATFYPRYQTDRNKIIIRSINEQANYIFTNKGWKKIPLSEDEIPIIHPRIKSLKPTSGSDSIRIVFHNGNEKKLYLQGGKFYKGKQFNDSLMSILTRPAENPMLFLLNLHSLKLHQINVENLPSLLFSLQLQACDHSIQIISNNYWAEIDSTYQIRNTRRFNNLKTTWRAFKDKEGNYWVSTFGDGVYFYLKKNFESEYFFKNEDIRRMEKTGIGITVSVLNKGIFYYDTISQKFKPFFTEFYPIHNFFIKNKKNYIISGESKNLFIKKGEIIQTEFGVPKRIFFLNNKYYLLNYSKLNILDTFYRKLNEISLGGQELAASFKDKIIVGGNGGLYSLLNDSVFEHLPYKEFSYPILSLKATPSVLYIGTDGYGLFVWDGQNTPQPVPGTENEIINSITLSGNGVWLGTQHGIKVFRQENDSIRYDFTLRKHDGLISDQIIFTELERGKLFAASYSGISVTDTLPPENKTIYNIYFKKILYNGTQPANKNFKVPYNKNNNLFIAFGVVDFSGQEHNRYYYRLLPDQPQWRPISNKEISLSNLQPDDYAFQVMVKNPYGQTVTKSLEFSITPLWWQTGFAKTGGILLFLLLMASMLWAIRRYEIKKNNKKLLLQKKMAELELHALRSQMNPHFVFNSLNAIQYYISEENYNQSENYLVKFARLIRMIFEFTRKKAIPLQQEIKLLRSYLELEKMRFTDKLNVKFIIDPAINQKRFQIPTMLLQPIVENAINHGIFHKTSPGTLQIEFKYIDDNAIEVIISDDGVGIKKAEEIKRKSLRKHKSRASEILAERIKLLNQSGKWQVTYKIEDLTGTNDPFSTRVTLKIKKL